MTAACICFPHEYELTEVQALTAMEKLNEFGSTSSCWPKHSLLNTDKPIVILVSLNWSFGLELSLGCLLFSSYTSNVSNSFLSFQFCVS